MSRRGAYWIEVRDRGRKRYRANVSPGPGRTPCRKKFKTEEEARKWAQMISTYFLGRSWRAL